MTDKEKSPTAIIAFVLFIVVLPIATVIFSKTGLDRYKEIRGEMRFLKDSIRVDFNQVISVDGATLNNGYIRGKLVLTGFANGDCSKKVETLVQEMKRVQERLSAEDQRKILFVLHIDPSTLSDSTVGEYRESLGVTDTSQWKLVEGGTPARYQIEEGSTCTTIALLDGRVSRKDKSDNYLKGPLLGDYYKLQEQLDEEALLRHMAILMPAKKRKSIEYKADTKLYHSDKDSTYNE